MWFLSLPIPVRVGDDIVPNVVRLDRGFSQLNKYDALFLFCLQMSALKAANQDLKGMMKSVKVQEIDVSWLLPVIPLYLKYH